MTYKLLFLDIDGTILKPDHTYTASTADAIRQMKVQGIEPIFASGRPFHEMTDLAEELHVTSYIGYNGAQAMYKGQTVVYEPMDGDMIRQFMAIAKDNHHEIVLYTHEKNYYTSLDSPAVVRFMNAFLQTEGELYHEGIADEILSVTILGVDKGQQNLYRCKPDLHLAQVNVANVKDSYDVMQSNVNKGTAVKRLLGYLGIPKEQTIAFGDAMNDKEMLLTVGEGFAMGNAHPDLFKYAKHTTTTVSNSGVYNGLKQLGLISQR